MESATEWDVFLHAMAEEVDASFGVAERDSLLHGVGERMAMTSPLPVVGDVAGIEGEINTLLAKWGWGTAALDLRATERVLFIRHSGLPVVGGAGDPPGTWLSALLEGLYETWIGQIQGGDRSLTALRDRVADGVVTLRYGRNR